MQIHEQTQRLVNNAVLDMNLTQLHLWTATQHSLRPEDQPTAKIIRFFMLYIL